MTVLGSIGSALTSGRRFERPRIRQGCGCNTGPHRNNGAHHGSGDVKNVRSGAYLHFDIAARYGGVHGGSNLFEVQFNNRPLRSAKHHKSNPAAFKVLLVAHVLVSGNKNVKSGLLRNGQKVTVAQRIPSGL